ncbi:hypothetical protein BRYFOR_07298 [Marvinbryantia formatexigens DSM 14469]|uniref:Uncharacterized protein n=1 Tax=Marvinbryantia formatexigens DSM 14469 TaxID=478749 RepID=C6LF97_9FIRM|nr:hypothetical protein BRYFOR_07298 [Marvinbryantia formatexigens DSM 14469]
MLPFCFCIVCKTHCPAGGCLPGSYLQYFTLPFSQDFPIQIHYIFLLLTLQVHPL